MAREYARIRISIADDEQFEDLTPEAQWLYVRVLIPEPSLSYAGVADWRPNRLVGKAQGVTLDYILRAAAELERRDYCLFDVGTEEVLVRSYIRHDELLRNPKMAPAVVKAYQSTASKTLRAAIVSEVQKAKDEHPEYTSWEHKDTKDDLARLLTRPGLDSVQYTNPITNGITNPIGNPDTVPITNTDPGPDYQSDSVPIPSHLSPSTYHQSPITPNTNAREPSPEQPPTRQTGSNKALDRFEGIPGQPSPLARQVAVAYSDSLPVPIEAKVLTQVTGEIDRCLLSHIPPDAIARGIQAWAESDSWSPSQIPTFVAKANRRPNGNHVGKPTESALSYQDAAEQLLAKVSTK